MTRLSKYRRATIEVLRLGTTIPLVTAQRRMSLKRLAAAREANAAPWPAIFVKAYAVLAKEMPVLRQAYFRFLLPHIHQYPFSDAAIAVERMIDGESVVYPLIVHHPEGYPISEMAEMIRLARTADPATAVDLRLTAKMAALPGPLLRAALCIGYNVPSYRRHFFGTFGLTTIAAHGGELLNLVTPLTTTLTYGPLAADGTIDVRIIFDHRVVDGAPVARALARLEQLLNGVVADEVEHARPPSR